MSCFRPFVSALMISLWSAVVTHDVLGEALRLSEPVEVTETYEVFGVSMTGDAPSLPLSSVVARSDEFEGETVRVTAEVKEVCQKKGCFFIASDGPDWARITFADYAFFVPTDSAGRKATLIGTFSRRQLSAEQAAHYASDLGEVAPDRTGPSYEYRIVATSVKLFKD